MIRCSVLKLCAQTMLCPPLDYLISQHDITYSQTSVIDTCSSIPGTSIGTSVYRQQGRKFLCRSKFCGGRSNGTGQAIFRGEGSLYSCMEWLSRDSIELVQGFVTITLPNFRG